MERITRSKFLAVTRKEKAAELRRLLAEYRGSRFHVESSGDDGMLLLRHRNGDEYFIGGLHGEGSDRLVRALNLVLELIHDT